MPQVNYVRHKKSKRVTLMSQATTTEIKVTTSVKGSLVNVSGYTEMAVIARVIANSTNDPGLGIQVSADGGTNWATHSTLDADMTTTANNTYTAVTNFGDSVRIVSLSAGITTTTTARWAVEAVLKT